MSNARDDRWITDAQGRALAGVQVYWCTQPANTSTIPPSPLATVYSDTEGDVTTQPAISDGFGHAFTYINNGILYTIVLIHPLFGPNPIVLPDQGISGPIFRAFGGVPSGTIDGTNTVFTFAVAGAPIQSLVWLNFPGIPAIGYTTSWLSGVMTITYSVAPQPGDSLYVQGLF
jgi:hypothetical protein